MRMFGPNLLAAVCLMSLLSTSPADADGKLTEQTMTQKDYKEITKTETSVPGERAIEKPLEVHDFSGTAEQGVKDAHGVKVIKGKDWKSLSPKDRDARMRALMKTMAPGTFYMIEVPSGNVWAIDEDSYFKLKQDKTIHRWTYDEETKLPVSVRSRPDNLQNHGDRRDQDLT
jgi:hypothetical protein